MKFLERGTDEYVALLSGLRNDKSGRPFRHPHFTVSEKGLRGSVPFPGELALAHGGTFMLTEPEHFTPACLRAIARAYRDKQVTAHELRQGTMQVVTRDANFDLVVVWGRGVSERDKASALKRLGLEAANLAAEVSP